MLDTIVSLSLMFCLSSLASAYLLFTWFDGAKFFLEYVKLFRLSWLFKSVENFNKIKAQGANINYLDYRMEYYDSFVTRLVTCPKCLSLWISGLFWIISSFIVLIFNKKYGIFFTAISPIASFASAFASYFLYKKITK